MLNVEESTKLLFRDDNVHKNIILTFPNLDLIIENDKIVTESLSLVETISSDDTLEIGSCNAATLKISVADIEAELIGEEFTVEVEVEESKVQLGTFAVATCERQVNRRFKDIVAYDRMKNLDVDASSWYNNTFTAGATLKEFRDALLTHFGIPFVEQTLTNDDVTVNRTVTLSATTAREMLKAVMELNGAFGRINRSGKFEAIILNDAVPVQETYTANDYHAENIPKYEDYMTDVIDKVQIKSEEDDIGAIVGDGTNALVIESNFICYGKTSEQLNTIATNLLDAVSSISYTPINGNFRGLPYVEVGDCIMYENNKSYVLNRTLSGIQALNDDFSINGSKTRSNLTDVNSTFTRLRALTHILRNTVEELESIITDEEDGLQTIIQQLKGEILLKATIQDIDNYIYGSARVGTAIVGTAVVGGGYDAKVSAELQINANEISTMVKKDELISTINQSAEKISANAVNIDLNGIVTFNDLENEGATIINGSNITTGTLESVGINIGNQFMVDKETGIVTSNKGYYGGWVIWDNSIYSIKDIIEGTTVLGKTRRNGFQAYGQGSYAISVGYLADLDSWANGYFTVTHSGNVSCKSIVAEDATIGGSTFNGHSHATANTINASLFETSNGLGNYIRFANGGEGATTGWCASTFQYKSSSDMRLKKNIQSIDDKLMDIYMELKPKIYQMKDSKEDESIRYGLLAQQVICAMERHNVDPMKQNLIEVVENAQGRDDGMYCLGRTHYRLNYENLHALHIKKIQSQQKEIESLSEEIKMLRNELNYTRRYFYELFKAYMD